MMPRDESWLEEVEGESRTLPVAAPEPDPAAGNPKSRPHLVVVRTREVLPSDEAPNGSTLVTTFWHPRDRRWNENYFESLEHAVRLFVDESGWALLQQQSLDGPQAYELIFEAKRADFSRPTTEELLEDVGLSADDVAKLLNRVDDRRA